MEKTEEIKKKINETNAAEPQRQETQKDGVSATNAEQQPQKKNHLGRVIIFLMVAAVVGISAWHFFKSRHQEDDCEYGYEYGDEPSYGYVSYSSGVSNIVNPDSREVIVKDIDWCHYCGESDEDPIVLFAKNGKRGYCNIVTNRIIVEPNTYTRAWIFSEVTASISSSLREPIC